MKLAAAAAVAVVLVSGVAQGQILRWDNGEPVPGTEFVDPVRYAAGDLRGYVFSNVDFSYADLRGLDMTGTSWKSNRGSKVDMRGTKWSGANRLPDSWSKVDLRGAYYPSSSNEIWLYNSSGIASTGLMRSEGDSWGDRWFSVFNDNLPAHSAAMVVNGYYYYEGLRTEVGMWPVLDGGEWLQPIHLATTQISTQPRPIDLAEHPLRISFRHGSQVTAGKTYDLFDWPYGNANQFEFIEVPAGSKWDLTRIYSTGEARLIEWPESNPTEFRKFYQSDLDLDADVDSVDMLAMLEGWTGADYAGDPIGVDHGDVDGDGDLDSADMLVMMTQWTGAQAAQRARARPEPAGLVLGLVGFLVMVRRVKR